MAIYDWPAYASDKAFWPETAELVQYHNNRELESPLSGDIQTNSVPGARWGWVLNFPEQSWDERGRLLAFLTRLNGKEHRVRLFPLHWPKPLSLIKGGTINTAGVTTSGAAAQFATSVTLQGVGGANLLTASRSIDNGAWTKDGVTVIANNNTDPEGGTTSDKLSETTANSPHRVFQTVSCPSAAVPFAGSALIAPNGRDWFYIFVRETTGSTDLAAWFNVTTQTLGTVSAGSNWSGATAALAVDGAGHTRLQVRGVKTNAATGLTYIVGSALSNGTQSYAGNVLSGFNVWGAMLEQASAAGSYALPRLQAMDMLSLGGQFVMNVADVVFSDLGQATIEFRHPLRAALAGGSAVTLLNPTSLFILTTSEFSSGLRSTRAPAFSISLREVFA